MGFKQQIILNKWFGFWLQVKIGYLLNGVRSLIKLHHSRLETTNNDIPL